MRRSGVGVIVVLSLGLGAAARAHDLGLDVTLNGTRASENNPRTGSAGFILSGSYDFSDRWTGFLTGMFVRDFATRSGDSYSAGSNIFLFSGGAMFLATDHLMFMATVSGSPPTVQRNATSVSGLNSSIDLLVTGTSPSLGGSLLASYATNGLSNWEHTFDLSAGVNHFEIHQVADVADPARARAFLAECTRATGRPLFAKTCELVARALANLREPHTEALTQFRVGAAYTATLFIKTDVGLDMSGYLYSVPDPLVVGSFLVQGLDVGLGTPVAPWRFTVRPSVLHRAGKFSVRLAYQLGVYTSNAGLNHLVSVKLTWKLSPMVRVSLSALGQTDVDGGVVVNRGGTITAGVLLIFP